MASPTHGNPATEAAAYLTRCGNVIPRSRGEPGEIRRQSAQLCEWAQQADYLIDYSPPVNTPCSKGAEHEVFFHPDIKRVFKRTYPGTFGSIHTEQGLRRTATPYFYLCRLDLTNDIFKSNMRFEGVSGGEKPSIIISQPWAYPADPKNPLPSLNEIRDFMTSLGFESVPDAPFEWFREWDGVRVSDARPDNFIKSFDGVIPIDLVVAKE